MRFASLATFVALAMATGSMAAPTSAVEALLHAPAVVPSAYRQLGLSPSSAPVEFTISLKGAKMDQLEARMLSIAQSGGNWLTDEELAEYSAPDPKNLAAVQAFLKSAGVPDSAISYSPAKDHITIQSNVGTVNGLFKTQLQDFALNGGAVVPKAKSLTIPASLSSFIADVGPLTSFAHVKTPTPATATKHTPASAELAARAVPSGCSTSGVTPTCLRNLYGTSSYTPSPVAGQIDIGVLGYIGQYVSQSDLTTFLNKYRPAAAGYKIPIRNAAGGTNDQTNPGVEAMLDVETVVAATYPLNSEFLYYGSQNGDIFAQGMQYYINNYNSTNRPKVISVSYGDIEQDFTSSQASAMCSTAQKLTSLGTTVVFASGDNGVDSVQADSAPSCSNGWVPTYPSGCPYILSVGGLQNFSPEVAVSSFSSGTGFSTLFGTPSYQNSAASSYKSALGNTASGYYNPNGRIFADVSAQASNYVIVVSGQTYTVGGTSAAAPTVASIIALLNDARRKAGKASVGWVHPTFYSNPSTFTDVTSGASYGCPSPDQNVGLPCATGFDGPSGLGSLQFSKLRSIFGV